MKDLVVSSAGVESFRVVAALYARAFDDPWPEPSVRELLSTPGTWVLIAHQSFANDLPQPVGFLITRLVVDEAEILSLAVDPDHRRIGIARNLVQTCQCRIAGHGGRSPFLEVGRDNSAAISLYRNEGYTQVGLRKNYYRRADGRRVDALLMQKKIAETA